MPRRGQFHHGAAASAWDSDSMFYVGMEYPNLGACSQKAPTSFQSRGSSPKTVVTSIDTASAGTLVIVSQPSMACQVERCENVAFDVGGMPPGALCEGHSTDAIQRAAHNERIHGETRSSPSCEDITRVTDDCKSSKHKAEIKPDTECAPVKQEPITASSASMNQSETTLKIGHEQEPVTSGSGIVVPPKSMHCQHPGCEKTPRYGHEGAPPIVCRSHKRAGMYTTRDGRLLVSTRDGKAVIKAVSPPADAPSTVAVVRTAPSRATAKRVLSVEGESSDPDLTWTPSSTSPRLQTMNRRLCEVMGCQVQPSYGPLGSTRPRFCSEHKGKGHVGLKNRPCLFPGCLTRPHYGLTKGRAVYCAAHKKNGMVHLLKESISLEKERAARDREESRRKVAERKKRKAAASARMANNDRDDGSNDDSDDDNDEEWTEESESGRVSSKRKSRSEAGSSRGSGSGRRGMDRRNKGGWSRRASASLAPADMESNEACASAYPLHSRLPDEEGVSSVMAPSVEIRLLQKARESARAAAEVSGSGRRARVPSRKLLEASGALENQGAQWTTREVKEADAQVKKELREQRKYFRAAGLKAGEDKEIFTVPEAGGGDSIADTRIEKEKCKFGGGGGGGGGGRSSDSGIGLSKKQSRQVQPHPPAKQQQQQRNVGGESVVSANIRARKGAVQAFSPATVDKLPLKRTWVVSVSNGSARVGESTTAKDDATESAPKRSKQGRDGHIRNDGGEVVSEAGGNASARKQKTAEGRRESNGGANAGERQGSVARKTKCEFGDCSETATFGVNGTVRYCKKHHLFGMHEIPQSS